MSGGETLSGGSATGLVLSDPDMTETWVHPWVFQRVSSEEIDSRRRAGRGFALRESFPAGYDMYLRVFYPSAYVDPVSGAQRLSGWREAAERQGLTFHAAIRDPLYWPGPPSDFEPLAVAWLAPNRPGVLAPWVRRAYVDILGPFTKAGVYFVGTEMTVVKPLQFAHGSIDALMGPELDDVVEVHWLDEDTGQRWVTGPDWFWSDDRRWIVYTNQNSQYAYVGCDREIADAFASDGRLEFFEIDLDACISVWAMDTINPHYSSPTTEPSD